MELEKLKKALLVSWGKDTSYYPDYDGSQLCYGQCFATVLVVNDYLGGKICKKKWGEDGHFWNLIDGKDVDLTRAQFKEERDFSNPEILDRKDLEIPKYDEQIERYKILKKKVEEFLNK